MIQLPKSCLVDKSLPKKMFYEQFNAIGKIKKLFVDEIKSLRLMYIISPDRMAIEATGGINGLIVMKVTFKTIPSDLKVIKFIDVHMDQYILFWLVCEDQEALAISYKKPIQSKNGECFKVERLFVTKWMNTNLLDIKLRGNSTKAIYDSLVQDIDPSNQLKSSSQALSMDDKIVLLKEIDVLKNNYNATSNKMNKQKQYNKRMVLFNELKALKVELNELEKQLEIGSKEC